MQKVYPKWLVVLRNICNKYFLQKYNIVYPKKLLPKKSYQFFDISEILKNGKFYLVRRSLAESVDKSFNEIGDATAIALIGTDKTKVDETIKMSFNILGGFFVSENICFLQKKNAMNDWKENTTPNFKEFKDFIEVEKHAIPIYFDISKIEGEPFLYYRKEDKKKPKKIEEKKLPSGWQKEQTEENSFTEYKGQCKLVHKPTISNFWHFELDLFPAETEVPITRKKADRVREEKGDMKNQHWTAQAAYHVLYSVLTSAGKKDLSTYEKIPETVYKKAV